MLMNDAADGAVPGEGSSPFADSVTPVDCAIAKDRTTAAIFDTRWVPAILLSLLDPGGFAPADPTPSLAGAPCPAPLRRARLWRASPVMWLAEQTNTRLS